MSNQLASQQSPYLLQHADNPVDWLPWGEQAFAKARQEDKPIFLSVGYSTCHWCHVMAHESFENSETARILNEHFVNIKVDREERPDVDHVYMTFVQATTGHGGWPMSVWLTPELKPFFGGTYFPPESRYGRPGFPELLLQIATAWQQNRERLDSRAGELIEILRQRNEEIAEITDSGKFNPEEVFDNAFRYFRGSYDETWGGFGGAPKFPRPVTFDFLLRYSTRRADMDGVRAAGMVYHTLRMMAAGGMHDHLGGGFHRYSVDETWHVPHFEKMLYDQGQLVCTYIAAYQLTKDQLFADTAIGILNYVLRDLRHPDGGFYSAEDADSLLSHQGKEHAEGAFYVWTQAEIETVLPPESARLICTLFGVEEDGNVSLESDPHNEFTGKNILIQRLSVPTLARDVHLSETDTSRRVSAAKGQLFEQRNRRPRPHLDDKVLVAWNGLMISAFAQAGAALDRPDFTEAAERAARFIRSTLYSGEKGELLRAFRGKAAEISGFAEDYAFLIAGLLDLFTATFAGEWLDWAIELQATLDRDFRDPKDGLYFSSNGRDPSVLVRSKSDYDGAEPAANSVIALNLLRLAELTSNAEYRAAAERILRAFSTAMKNAPHAIPLMISALDTAHRLPRQLVITSNEGKEAAAELLKTARSFWTPGLTVLGIFEDDTPLAKLHPETAEMRTKAKGAAAWLCQNFQCELPITSVEKLRERLDGPPAG